MNGNCENTDGGFTCSCKSGYSGNGTNCEGTIDFLFFLFWKNLLIYCSNRYQWMFNK